LGGFYHILKLPVNRDWLFQLGRNRRHGFEEATALQTLARSPSIFAPREAFGLRRVHHRFFPGRPSQTDFGSGSFLGPARKFPPTSGVRQ
jgi:hypothetical protein